MKCGENLVLKLLTPSSADPIDLVPIDGGVIQENVLLNFFGIVPDQYWLDEWGGTHNCPRVGDPLTKLKFFSLRSCRSSSVIFFDCSQGNLVGNLVGILSGLFLTHRTKAQKFRGKYRSIFCKKIRSSKKSFAQNSLCRRTTLRNSGDPRIPRLDPRKPKRR